MNPTSDFPTSLHSPTNVAANSNSALGSTTPKHTEVEGKQEQEIVAIQEKLGIGASNASSASTGQVLTKKSDGSTAWETPTTVSDGDKGDITVSGSGATWTIDNDVVTYAKMQNVSATSRILGRSTAGAGDVEELAPATVRTMINVADGANNYSHPNHSGDVTSVGDGATTIANDSVTFAKMQNIATDRLLGRDTASTGDPEEVAVGGGIEFTGSGGIQTSAFTGDVTKTAGGTATTIANDAVTYAKMQNVSATNRFLGRITSGAGDPEELTGTQATTLLDAFTSTLKGLAPASGGGTSNFLRADGSWAAPTATATPAGTDTQIQFNDGGSLGADAGLTYNKTTDDLSLLGELRMGNGSTTGDLIRMYYNGGGGNITLAAGETFAGEFGLVIPQFKVTGGRADFDQLDNKAEIRISGALTQLGFYNKDNLNFYFKVESDLDAFFYGVFTNSKGAVFNEDGIDSDFRVEGDNDANTFFVDAGVDRVGIGNNAPSEKLDVTGNVKLNNLVINNALADDSTSGIVASFTAAESLVYGDVCYINSAGKMAKADADAIATSGAVAIARQTLSTDDTGSFLLNGIIRDDSGYAFTVGGLIYLSTTAGGITQTAPSGTDDVVQVLGVAINADKWLFNPSLVQTVIV